MVNLNNLILSASGWRKVFAVSGNENDADSKIGEENTALAMLAAETFTDYIREQTGKEHICLVCGIDTRPTGPEIADAMIRVLLAKHVAVKYVGVNAAPEIMAFSRSFDGFIYISASHNPIGHNGIKFGLHDGGVVCAEENAKLVKTFKERCAAPDAEQRIRSLAAECSADDLEWVYNETPAAKKEGLAAYRSFIESVIAGSENRSVISDFFSLLKSCTHAYNIGVVCDMNGSARTLSIDRELFKSCGINFYTIHDKPGEIAHGIIPEPENLVWCAKEMERLQKEGHTDAVLGYMPDCDGDRGNIVYWDEKNKRAAILKAQEVFSLSVLSELAFFSWRNRTTADYKPAVVVNCPTSMRIEDIAAAFKARVFRAEVGEANVVNLARQKRAEGYTVRILGEGSNGGNITHPEAVRDPINTIFALIKLLVLHNNDNFPGLYKIWCKNSGTPYSAAEHITLTQVIKTLPVYVTTGVSEQRALLHIKTQDHALLKRRFQNEFIKEWNVKQVNLQKKYGIYSYKAVATNGTVETMDITDYGISGRGGLKIIFYDKDNRPAAFIWMRGSGTEPVFRIMCDVKGSYPDREADLLKWETQMLENADAGE